MSPPLSRARHWLYTATNYERMPPIQQAQHAFNLANMEALLQALGRPERSLGAVIHIAGSKGKGSTAAIAAGLLQAAGHRVGLYTSPHLIRLEERVAVNRRPVAARQLDQALARVRRAIAAHPLPGPLTFFEALTAAAFLVFARRETTATVLETGLGGRLDATNAVTPRVAVITAIGREHTAILGHDLASIAREKAGIIKPGRPVISGVTDEPARGVIARCCRRRRCSLLVAGPRLAGAVDSQRAGPPPVSRCRLVTPGGEHRDLNLPLLGRHQALNAALALAAVESAQGQPLDRRTISRGLGLTRLRGRQEPVAGRPPLILDGAHTPPATALLLETVNEIYPGRDTAAVFALARDKDLAGIFRRLVRRVRFLAPLQVDRQRGFSAAELAAAWAKAGGRPAGRKRPPHYRAALAAAQKAVGPAGLVLVTGSLYLVGEALRLVRQGQQEDGPPPPEGA